MYLYIYSGQNFVEYLWNFIKDHILKYCYQQKLSSDHLRIKIHIFGG